MKYCAYLINLYYSYLQCLFQSSGVQVPIYGSYNGAGAFTRSRPDTLRFHPYLLQVLQQVGTYIFYNLFKYNNIYLNNLFQVQYVYYIAQEYRRFLNYSTISIVEIIRFEYYLILNILIYYTGTFINYYKNRIERHKQKFT